MVVPVIGAADHLAEEGRRDVQPSGHGRHQIVPESPRPGPGLKVGAGDGPSVEGEPIDPVILTPPLV